MISKISPTVITVWPLLRSLSRRWNVPSAAVLKTRAIIDRCTKLPQALRGNDPVNWPTSSGSTLPPGPPFSAPGRPPISLLMKQFLPPVHPWEADVQRMANLPPLPEISYDVDDSYDTKDNSTDLGTAEGKPPVTLKQTEFSLNQYAKRTGQANKNAFNRWQKVLAARLLKW